MTISQLKGLLANDTMFARSFFLSSRLSPRLPCSIKSRSVTASRRFSSPSRDSRPLRPREFPSSGFEIIDPSERVEEERLPFYKRDEYYPMRICEVLEDRYQVVAKLGYGTNSTAWLGRDLG